MKKSSLISWRALWTAILIVIVLFLAFYNLEYFPRTSFDEGLHLLVAKKLALEGKYQFGPAVGPTVFFPIAAAFRVVGVGLLPARVVMVGYLFLCVATFYVLARYLGGWKVATAGTLLFVSSPGVKLLRWGRQALGEVPAALFFLLGTLVWLNTLEEEPRGRRRGRLILTGVLVGLGMLSKNHLLLWVPAWLLLWVADRRYYRQLHHSDFVLPLCSAIACVATWYVGQRFLFPAGEHLARHNVQEWSNVLSRGILTFSPQRMVDAIKFLTSQDTFYAWVLPGGLYAAILSLRRSRGGLRWALLVLVVIVWLSWFTLLSVGWPRYAFLPLTVTAIFVARLFHDLTDGFHIPVKELWAAIRARRWDLAVAGKLALLTLLTVIILRPMQGRFIEVVGQKDTSPQAMAAYIEAHMEPETQIETWEPEICFLTGYQCYFPPVWAMDAAIKYVWYDAPPPSQYYDFRQHDAQYLLIGDFGRWTHLYDPKVVKQHYELCTSIGGYELYQVKTEEDD